MPDHSVANAPASYQPPHGKQTAFGGRRSKYKAVRTWACIRCLAPAKPVRITRKSARDCPQCRAMNAVWCFASKAEFDHWSRMVLLERIGEIRNLEYQPAFPLVVNGVSLGKYTADARYQRESIVVVEEFKGYRTREAELKRKLCEALYRISVDVVSASPRRAR